MKPQYQETADQMEESEKYEERNIKNEI